MPAVFGSVVYFPYHRMLVGLVRRLREHLWTAPPWQEILVGRMQVGR